MSTLAPLPPTEPGPEEAPPSEGPRPGLARSRAPQRLALVFAASLLVGMAAGGWSTSPARTAAPATLPISWLYDPDEAPRKAMVEHLAATRQALEHYGTEENGSYPSAVGWVATLRKYGYAGYPGSRLPTNPYGDGKAAVPTDVVAWPARLPRAQPIADGKVTFPPLGTDLGPGRGPGEPGPPDALVYGTLLYDYAPDNQVYIVYAIGRRGDRAVLVAATSNGSC